MTSLRVSNPEMLPPILNVVPAKLVRGERTLSVVEKAERLAHFPLVRSILATDYVLIEHRGHNAMMTG
jgi:hypothetical protein